MKKIEPKMSYTNKLHLIKLGLLPKEAIAKEKKAIPKISKKRAAEMKENKDNSGDSGLDKWFEERRAEMKGICCLCGQPSEKHNDDTYRRSIHHLFEKRKKKFPSVALHPDNWLELCFHYNSCHTNIHNGTITWLLLKDSSEWNMIVEKVKKVYPFINLEERKNIPEILLKELQ